MSAAADTPEPHELTPFEGWHVSEARIEIPSAAGGLQEAMAFDPIELQIGDEVFVLMHLVCGKVRHEPIDPKAEQSDLRRVHILKPAGGDSAMFLERAEVEAQLKARQETLRIKRERAAGVFRLEIDPEDKDEGGGYVAKEDDDQ